jgi:hypothetical protein
VLSERWDCALYCVGGRNMGSGEKRKRQLGESGIGKNCNRRGIEFNMLYEL